MDTYKVTIGDDVFEVEAEDNQRARYKAAELFKDKYSIRAWLTDLVAHAKARLVTSPESTETTVALLKLFKDNAVPEEVG